MKFLRQIPKLFLILTLIFLLASCGKKPDVIYINGKIYTLDKDNSVVESIAVQDGKIIATGKTKELTEKYPNAKTIDLKGKTVVPGFNDAEGNLMEFSKQLGLVDLRNAKSLNEIKILIAEKVKSSERGEWVGGFGWDETQIPEKEIQRLDHFFLDSISTDHHIYLVNALGNTTLVNKPVFALTKVTKDTPDPPNGAIGFNDRNEPTGFYYDDAQEFIMKLLPQPSESQIRKNIERGISELYKYGITGIDDANMSEDVLNLYKKMTDDKKFGLRLYAMIPGKGTMFEKYLKEGPQSYKDRIEINCMSLEYDGYFETQDAAMENDYLAAPKRKTPYNDDYDISEMTKKANGEGFQVSVKCVGDRAVKFSLNAIESANKVVKSKVGRTRFEYIEFISPNDIQRIKQFEIIPSVRPEVTLFNKMTLKNIISEDNGKNLGLWNTLFKTNNRIISGSDFPYHSISPLLQIYYLSTGMSLDAEENKINNNSAQKISVLDALKSFTVWSAYANFSEETRGSLETGKFADMVVLSNDILTSDTKILLNTKVLMTIFNGEVVYENKSQGAFLSE